MLRPPPVKCEISRPHPKTGFWGGVWYRSDIFLIMEIWQNSKRKVLILVISDGTKIFSWPAECSTPQQKPTNVIFLSKLAKNAVFRDQNSNTPYLSIPPPLWVISGRDKLFEGSILHAECDFASYEHFTSISRAFHEHVALDSLEISTFPRVLYVWGFWWSKMLIRCS